MRSHFAFYTVTRYPDVEVSFNTKKVSSVVEATKEVIEWVRQILK